MRTLIFTLGQLFLHAMLLGLGSDLLALRQAGHGADRLVGVHNLGAIAAWVPAWSPLPAPRSEPRSWAA